MDLLDHCWKQYQTEANSGSFPCTQCASIREMCLIWRFCRAENTISCVLSTRATGSNCSNPARLESLQVLTRKPLHSSIDGAKCLKIGGIEPWVTRRRCARGSGRRREDAGPERRRFGRGTDFRPIGAGRSRTGRNTWHEAAERQDHCVGARGLRTRRMDGHEEARSVVGVPRNQAGWQSGWCT